MSFMRLAGVPPCKIRNQNVEGFVYSPAGWTLISFALHLIDLVCPESRRRWHLFL